MRSWKTTLAGAVTALTSFVIFSQELHMLVWPQWAIAVAMFANVGGLATFGVVSKDYNVSGTNPVINADKATK
jgi:hypothetical protein